MPAASPRVARKRAALGGGPPSGGAGADPVRRVAAGLAAVADPATTAMAEAAAAVYGTTADRPGTPEAEAARLRKRQVREAVRLTLTTAILLLFFHIGSNLDYHQEWGLEVIRTLKTYKSPMRDRIVKSFSVLGFEVVVPAVPFLVWYGGNKSRRVHDLGLDIHSTLMFLLCVCSLMKIYFEELRPFHHGLGKPTGAASSGAEEFSFPSGHAWGTTVYWLLVNDRFREETWLRWVGVLAVVLCSFSRVWSSMHYPHDVMVGASLGVLMFLWKRFYLVFDAEKRRRHELTQLLVWVTLTAVSFSSLLTQQEKQNQRGLFFSMGSLMGCVIFRNRVLRVLDHAPIGQPPWSRTRTFSRRVMRLVLGLIPVITAHRIVHSEAWGEYNLIVIFTVSIFISSWLLYYGPLVWFRIGLATDLVPSSLGTDKIRRHD